MEQDLRRTTRWIRTAVVVGLTTLVVAPVTAYASHRFTDVPTSHTFHDDITWLADADITRGCNPPTNDMFCPDDPVTRGQMSAFLLRFADHLAARDGTPALADVATTVKNGAITRSKLASDMRPRWAEVASGCTLEQGRGVVDVAVGTSAHHCLVTFERTVDECAALATVAQAGGFATATHYFAPPGDTVNVVTRDETGANAQRAFFVQLVC